MAEGFVFKGWYVFQDSDPDLPASSGGAVSTFFSIWEEENIFRTPKKAFSASIQVLFLTTD
jgi:hypothetical protein